MSVCLWIFRTAADQTQKISAGYKTQAGLFSTTDKRHSIDRPGSIALNLKSNPARVQNLRTPPDDILCADFGTNDSTPGLSGERER